MNTAAILREYCDITHVLMHNHFKECYRNRIGNLYDSSSNLLRIVKSYFENTVIFLYNIAYLLQGIS